MDTSGVVAEEVEQFNFAEFLSGVAHAVAILRYHGAEPASLNVPRSVLKHLQKEFEIMGLPATEPLYLEGIPCIIIEETVH